VEFICGPLRIETHTEAAPEHPAILRESRTLLRREALFVGVGQHALDRGTGLADRLQRLDRGIDDQRPESPLVELRMIEAVAGQFPEFHRVRVQPKAEPDLGWTRQAIPPQVDFQLALRHERDPEQQAFASARTPVMLAG
jgi:hypothetical protein